MKFNDIVTIEKEQAQHAKIFAIDIPLDDYINRYFQYGTSSQHSGISQKQYSIIQRVPEHRVVFNTIPFDKSIYSEFPKHQTDKTFVIKTKGLCIIRLPKRQEPKERSLSLENKGKNEQMSICYLYRKYSLGDILIVKSKPNRIMSLYSFDYHNGFFYIILPDPACRYHELDCEVILPDGTQQKLHIDLDQTFNKSDGGN